MSVVKPSDMAVCLGLLPADGKYAADEVRGRINRVLGFQVSRQWTAATLRRLARLDLPPVVVHSDPFDWGVDFYQLTTYGATWLWNTCGIEARGGYVLPPASGRGARVDAKEASGAAPLNPKNPQHPSAVSRCEGGR